MQIKNLINSYFSKFFRKLKGGQLSIDELSLFLITFALITAILLTILSLNQFVFLTWVPILIAYWRSFSKNRAKRSKENQVFIKYYYPVNSFVKNTYRRLASKQEHRYFKCKACVQELRIPKKTGHIKVTCPKCNYSFVKKTARGYIRKLKKKVT
jgi:hypothetical protein